MKPSKTFSRCHVAWSPDEMLETGMKFVEPVWQTESKVCCWAARSHRSLFRERNISVGLGGGGYCFISEFQWFGNSVQLRVLGVKYLRYKLLKFFCFHENEPSRHSQIQDKGSLLHVCRQRLILAMEGKICRKQLYQLLLDYCARKTFVLLYK